jgi:hypothetical protein
MPSVFAGKSTTMSHEVRENSAANRGEGTQIPLRGRRVLGDRKAIRFAQEAAAMMAVIVILVILWVLGIVTKNTLGGALHILLVIAVIFLLINVIRGRGV